MTNQLYQPYSNEHYLMTEHLCGTTGVAKLYATDPNSAYWQVLARQAQNALMILFTPDQAEIFTACWAERGWNRTWREAWQGWTKARDMLQAGEQLTTILEELSLLEGGA